MSHFSFCCSCTISILPVNRPFVYCSVCYEAFLTNDEAVLNQSRNKGGLPAQITSSVKPLPHGRRGSIAYDVLWGRCLQYDPRFNAGQVEHHSVSRTQLKEPGLLKRKDSFCSACVSSIIQSIKYILMSFLLLICDWKAIKSIKKMQFSVFKGMVPTHLQNYTDLQ